MSPPGNVGIAHFEQAVFQSPCVPISSPLSRTTATTVLRPPLCPGGNPFMRFLHSTGTVDSLAFLVIPDHVHWLYIPQPGNSLGDIMQRFKSWTARVLKTRHAIEGTIWQAAYHDRALRREEEIRSVARYIVANPLRAGLVDEIGEYSHWDAVWL